MNKSQKATDSLKALWTGEFWVKEIDLEIEKKRNWQMLFNWEIRHLMFLFSDDMPVKNHFKMYGNDDCSKQISSDLVHLYISNGPNGNEMWHLFILKLNNLFRFEICSNPYSANKLYVCRRDNKLYLFWFLYVFKSLTRTCQSIIIWICVYYVSCFLFRSLCWNIIKYLHIWFIVSSLSTTVEIFFSFFGKAHKKRNSLNAIRQKE